MGNFSNHYVRIALILLLGVTFWWILSSPNFKQETTEQKSTKQTQSWRLAVNENDLDLLARVVHSESKGEPYDGQVAVAAVIINRVQHPEFPNTIPGVVYEPLAFSVVANGQINKPADEISVRAAHDALSGFDPTGGALYFYNPSKTQSTWIRNRPVVKTIGKHVFSS